jgi:type IV fimbrial biogenesis protein FimT
VTPSRGFSLIEVLVVLVIVAIGLTFAEPGFQNLIANQRARAAATGLHSALLKARSEAVKRNADATLAPTGIAWEGGWRILDAASKVVLDQQALSGVSITGGPAQVVYDSTGRIATGAAPSFEVASTAISTIRRCVSVDPSGRPYLKATSC